MKSTRFTFSLWAALGLPLLSSCLNVLAPRRDFAAYPSPPAPDYSQEDSWAALPERRDSADAVPKNSGLRDRQRNAAVDVFFLHPTTYYGRGPWNAALTDAATNRVTDRNTIRNQASVFNSVGRIYAPRYRQATLYSFFDEPNPSSKAAIDLAYIDVKAAFQYFLDHYHTSNRPIILAGHSQGTYLTRRLLHDFFENDPVLRKQLVAAYLVGHTVKPDEFTTIRPCEDSTQTGCYVSWNTVEWGQEYPQFSQGVATNPLTWTRDTATAPAALNLGGVPFLFNRVDKGVVDARPHQGLLWVHVPKPVGYLRFILPGMPELRHSFHVADYGLFYMNVRHNAETRVRTYRRSIGRQ
ncbi:DUF3089 domain-containing protein [Hymenobacter sp. BT175]|uniref:DUF3089 domain-containing protein n=1 Tax=Hymenobacter translucens TaxID=2886507 RepID=UPI001D0E5033|nr:DUF3089 domain-containing protein [Hymenobacter translucens]MCC2548403.1 DUF3089 domain-containing protein [Hymenobacter translucens]